MFSIIKYIFLELVLEDLAPLQHEIELLLEAAFILTKYSSTYWVATVPAIKNIALALLSIIAFKEVNSLNTPS